MTDQRDPPPLKRGNGAPPELLRALHALGKQDADAARLRRVSAALGARLDAPPPPSAVAIVRHAPRKLLGAKLAIAALALGGTTFWLTRPPAPEAARPAESAAVAEKLPSPAAVTPDEPDAPTHAFTKLASAEPAASDAQRPTAERAVRASTARGATSSQHGVAATRRESAGSAAKRAHASKRGEHELEQSSRAQRAGEGAAGSESRGSQASELSTRRVAEASSNDGATAETQAERVAAEQPAAEQPEQPTAARPSSEVELLFEARQLLRREPARALRLLDEHAARFREGLLVPEREVLAIEALRELGQKAEAERRLRLFRSRYPASLHLKGLEQPAR